MARLVVAMSGGVDSSTTAALLAEQGHDVVGVHMRLHDAGPGAATCCGLDDAADARRVADALGIPFYVMDLREAFDKAVMTPFADAYAAGRTPNPCTLCNGVLKFRVLLARAMALGAEALVTGHYCRADDDGLRMAVDRDKDQSYFLFPLTADALPKVRFPLGELTKDEVRAHAARLGLLVADKAESQDVCFLPAGDHAAFVEQRHDDLEGAGAIVDADGTVLGQHDGYWRFTVGQRRGLGISPGYRAYVTAIDPTTRTVTVGPVEALGRRGLVADGLTWFRAPEPDEIVGVRVRHRGALHAATVAIEGDVAHVDFLDPVAGIAPGQAAVVYAGDRVLGGGWIRHAVEDA